MAAQITWLPFVVDHVAMEENRRRPLGNYGLSIMLGLLFLSSWAAQFAFQAMEFRDEALTHGQAVTWQEFWPTFLAATFENWQSEFLQLFSFVVLATYLIHKGSPQSRDGDDELRDQVGRIEDRLDAIHFRLFEEPRMGAERFFDEHRKDPDYDQAYRQAWRALNGPEESDGPGSPLPGP